MQDVSYSVVINNGQQDELIEGGLSQEEAAKTAKETAKEFSGVFVTWKRESDGQIGYLSPFGNHELEGTEWEHYGSTDVEKDVCLASYQKAVCYDENGFETQRGVSVCFFSDRVSVGASTYSTDEIENDRDKRELTHSTGWTVNY